MNVYVRVSTFLSIDRLPTLVRTNNRYERGEERERENEKEIRSPSERREGQTASPSMAFFLLVIFCLCIYNIVRCKRMAYGLIFSFDILINGTENLKEDRTITVNI